MFRRELKLPPKIWLPTFRARKSGWLRGMPVWPMEIWVWTAEGISTMTTRAARVVIVDMPSAVQTQNSIGHTGIPRNHPDFLALNVGNQIFGGSFNSRLNMKIRAQEGLTYDASSSFDCERQAGVFTVSTFTRTEKTAAAVRMIVDLLQQFHLNPAEQTEFDEAKAFLSGSFALATETSGQVADRV